MTAYIGGGLMQSQVAEEDAVIDRNVNFIASARLPKFKESLQCSGCGICNKNCPAGLSVKRIADLMDQGDKEAAISYHPEYCISCGSCSYSCLAGRNLAMRVKAAKAYSEEAKGYQ
jgi:Na+-translocating ferredoxin:NAD+ oxidoreductase RnfC subunit